MADYRQSEEYNKYFELHGWVVEKAGSAVVLVKKIPLLGSVIKIKRCPPDINLSLVESLAKKYRGALIKIEVDISLDDPDYKFLEEQFRKEGYSDSCLAYCPTKTSYIDLTKSEEDILLSFDGEIQKEIKRNENNGVSVEVAENIEDIYSLIEYAGKSRHFIFQKFPDWKCQWDAFSEKAKVLLAYEGGNLLGGNMFVVEDHKAYGIFLPLSEAGRKKHAAYTLLWEGFKWAKKEGCKTFDLEGIYDARFGSPKAWLGLTAFKRKFTGKEVEFFKPKIKARVWYLKPFIWAGVL